ncbi:N-lysine methyltransferase SETD8-A, partial [Austrofundulus limnaeus]|uniref:N-lysine methyltransferase SETD8-A n=1 Tax=Austrofundulus limnaeus TaxID=52670 RepID=A0A2I4AKI6_AUSLI
MTPALRHSLSLPHFTAPHSDSAKLQLLRVARKCLKEDTLLGLKPSIQKPKMSKRRARKKPADEASFYIQSSKDKPGLVERFIDKHKGRGVFATQPFEQGDFILEYRGQLLSAEKCQTRKYSEKESTFLFDFEWQNLHWCIDASVEDGSLGRLVNDNHKSPNCTMKKTIVNDKPHLCLFAIKNIKIGTEIDHNYGNSKWPWREKAAAASAAVEPSRKLCDYSQDDSIKQDSSLQLKGSQAPAASAEFDSSRKLCDYSQDDSIKQDSSLQLKGSQAPAASAEVEPSRKLCDYSQDDSIKQDSSLQVKGSQAPAASAEVEPSRKLCDYSQDDRIKQDSSLQ